MVARSAPLPNVRKLFIPDPGYIIFECDLAGADAQVVAWEADDEDLKAAFRRGENIHFKNALDMFNIKLEGDTGKKNPAYKWTKTGVHATTYIASARALCAVLPWSLTEAENFQRKWFYKHPKIKDWHQRIQAKLFTSRIVENAFGFRCPFLDRIEGILPEAVAWIPQSTVAIITFKGAQNVRRNLPWVQILLQVHDSLVMQCPIDMWWRRKEIKEQLSITVPYPDPLIIPMSLKASEKSWGDAKSVEW